MPVYNEIAHIDAAVASVLSQDHPNFELVIVDNQSTDGTYEKLIEYSRQDDRIRLYHNDENNGFIGNSNKAYSLARGEYIVILHGDDSYAVDDYISFVAATFDAHPNVGLLFFLPPRAIKKHFRDLEVIKSKDVAYIISGNCYIPGPKYTAFRRNATYDTGYYGNDYWTGEFIFCLNYALKGQYDMMILPEGNRFITNHGGDSSKPYNRIQRIFQYYKLYEKVKDGYYETLKINLKGIRRLFCHGLLNLFQIKLHAKKPRDEALLKAIADVENDMKSLPDYRSIKGLILKAKIQVIPYIVFNRLLSEKMRIIARRIMGRQ
jgi:glycosyltransferase involved in cell wall biosynthesis